MKGVIFAAGYGTRFLPVTKTIPKEMLPLGTRPSIDFIIEEFARSGIRETIIVSSRRKKALEDYFDREVELEAVFRAEGAEGNPADADRTPDLLFSRSKHADRVRSVESNKCRG